MESWIDDPDSRHNMLGAILLAVFMFYGGIILANLLIAMMSDTYQKVFSLSFFFLLPSSSFLSWISIGHTIYKFLPFPTYLLLLCIFLFSIYKSNRAIDFIGCQQGVEIYDGSPHFIL